MGTGRPLQALESIPNSKKTLWPVDKPPEIDSALNTDEVVFSFETDIQIGAVVKSTK